MKTDEDAFADFCNQKRKTENQHYWDIISNARADCTSDSGEAFIDSCEEFLHKNGALTEKQIKALETMADASNYTGERDEYWRWDNE